MPDDSALEFPCRFPIKLMGRDTEEFRTTARQLIEEHTGPVPDDAVQCNLSNKGNFVSVTITISATSQAQLDAIYVDASAHDDVLLAL